MDDAALLIAELLTRRWLPRSHPRVKRALVDAELFAQVEQRLAQSGLRWMDSIYADHVSVALLSAAQNGVMGESGLNANNNLELPRDAQALLIVLWALIVLPKRERQTSRVQEADAGQNDFFPGAKPLPQASVASPNRANAAVGIMPSTPAVVLPKSKTWPSRSSNGAVNAPRPGPISTTRSSRCGAMAATIPPITCASIRKFCPKRLRAMCLLIRQTSIQTFQCRLLMRPIDV